MTEAELLTCLLPEFVPFPSIKRLSRECIVTEKIDGTNAQVYIPPDKAAIYAGSRNRWLKQDADNYGFWAWVNEHRDALIELLGPGRHYGEWWGPGINRGYGFKERRFSLFNVQRWKDLQLPWISAVPTLYRGDFSSEPVNAALVLLDEKGSVACPGFMRPEGIVVYHVQSQAMFKKTLDGDGHKSQQKEQVAA